MAEVDLKKKLTVAPEITLLKATDDKKAEIKWTKVPLAEKYDIKRCLTPNGEFTHVDWATGTSFADATVEKDTTYWYKVVAWKRMEGKKTSQKPSAVKAVTVSDIPCVNNLSASVHEGNIQLTWNKSEGDKYYVYRRCDYFSRLIFIGESKINSFLDEKAISGKIYHYCVQTVKNKDGKELHGNFSVETDCAFVDTTEILSAKTTMGNKAILDVRVIAGADGYIFERSDKKDGEFIEVGRTDDITAVNFEDKLPSRFKNYYYRARAYKKAGEREYLGGYSAVKSTR